MCPANKCQKWWHRVTWEPLNDYAFTGQFKRALTAITRPT